MIAPHPYRQNIDYGLTRRISTLAREQPTHLICWLKAFTADVHDEIPEAATFAHLAEAAPHPKQCLHEITFMIHRHFPSHETVSSLTALHFARWFVEKAFFSQVFAQHSQPGISLDAQTAAYLDARMAYADRIVANEVERTRQAPPHELKYVCEFRIEITGPEEGRLGRIATEQALVWEVCKEPTDLPLATLEIQESGLMVKQAGPASITHRYEDDPMHGSRIYFVTVQAGVPFVVKTEDLSRTKSPRMWRARPANEARSLNTNHLHVTYFCLDAYHTACIIDPLEPKPTRRVLGTFSQRNEMAGVPYEPISAFRVQRNDASIAELDSTIGINAYRLTSDRPVIVEIRRTDGQAVDFGAKPVEIHPSQPRPPGNLL